MPNTRCAATSGHRRVRSPGARRAAGRRTRCPPSVNDGRRSLVDRDVGRSGSRRRADAPTVTTDAAVARRRAAASTRRRRSARPCRSAGAPRAARRGRATTPSRSTEVLGVREPDVRDDADLAARDLAQQREVAREALAHLGRRRRPRRRGALHSVSGRPNSLLYDAGVRVAPERRAARPRADPWSTSCRSSRPPRRRAGRPARGGERPRRAPAAPRPRRRPGTIAAPAGGTDTGDRRGRRARRVAPASNAAATKS